MKKAKKGEVIPEPSKAEFQKLNKELMQELIRERVSAPDCNAGVIFDGLDCIEVPDVKEAFECIFDALPKQNIQVLMFNFLKDDDEAEICYNYRFKRRKEEPELKVDKSKLSTGQASKVSKQTKMGASAPKGQVKGRGGKGNDKTVEEKPTETEVKEDEVVEIDEKDEPKPMDYTPEDKEKWLEFYKEMEEIITNINLRQMNMDDDLGDDEEEAKEEGEEGDGEEKAPSQAEKPAEDAQPAEGEEGKEGEEEVKSVKEKIKYGKRMVSEMYIHYDFKFLCEQAKKEVPEPIWPDPDKEPLPPPVTHQIVKKPGHRSERHPLKNYSIWTPKPKAEDAEEGAEEELENETTRWILQPKETKRLVVKFFSQKTGGNEFDKTLQFEIVGGAKPFNLNLSAVCEFPTINSNFKNVFTLQKKSRPANPPDCFIRKAYVQSEGVFDFGPLLVGKNPEKRDEEAVKKMNSSVFRITNNGKYDLNCTFALRSSMQIEGQVEKSPFISTQK